MTTPAHIAGGYLALSLTQQWWGQELTVPETRLLLLVGLGLSVLPDVDVLWPKTNFSSHHDLFPHHPWIWVLVSVAFWLVGLVADWHIVQALGGVIFIASMVHFVLDTFGVAMGMKWLKPFSEREVSFTKTTGPFADQHARVAYYKKNWWRVYWRDGVVITLAIIYWLVRG